MVSTPVEATRAGKREWIGLAVIALLCLLYSMDLTVLHLAVPRLTEDLALTLAFLTACYYWTMVSFTE